MTTYTPKVGSMGEPWMMRDPQGGWVSLADHEEAMRQANADPNDIAWASPPPEKVDHYKLVPVAEWEALRQARADRDVLAIEVRRLWSWAKKGATTWTPRVSQALDRAGGGA